jgi:hypothetical protein
VETQGEGVDVETLPELRRRVVRRLDHREQFEAARLGVLGDRFERAVELLERPAVAEEQLDHRLELQRRRLRWEAKPRPQCAPSRGGDAVHGAGATAGVAFRHGRQAAGLGTHDEDITTVIDTSDHYELRWKAIRAHASQISPFEIMPADLQRAFLATDRLRRILPPWTGGPLERQLLHGG